MIEVQCTSCHTRYRIDEQVLPEGTPTFKCSRCGHVFSVDPRRPEDGVFEGVPRQGPQRVPRMRPDRSPASAKKSPLTRSPRAKLPRRHFPRAIRLRRLRTRNPRPNLKMSNRKRPPLRPKLRRPKVHRPRNWSPDRSRRVARNGGNQKPRTIPPSNSKKSRILARSRAVRRHDPPRSGNRIAVVISPGSMMRHPRRPTSSFDHRLVRHKRRSFWMRQRCRKSMISCERKLPLPSTTRR